MISSPFALILHKNNVLFKIFYTSVATLYPAFIHNTNNCYDTRVLIRDIEYQIIINWHHS